MNNRAVNVWRLRVSYAPLLAMGLVSLGWGTAVRADEPATQLPCNGQASDADIAATLAMSTERLARLKAKHQLSNDTFCALTPARYLTLNFALDAPSPSVVAAGLDRWEQYRLQDEFGVIDSERLAEANRNRQINLARIDVNQAHQRWRNLDFSSAGGSGGRVLSLALLPNECLNATAAAGYRMVIGTAQNGLWYSDDGATWQAAGANAYYTMGQIALNSLIVGRVAGSCGLYAGGGQLNSAGVAIGSASPGLLNSRDGRIWTPDLPTSYGRTWFDVTASAAGNTTWVAQATTTGTTLLRKGSSGWLEQTGWPGAGCRISSGNIAGQGAGDALAHYSDTCGTVHFPDSRITLPVGDSGPWLRTVAQFSGNRGYFAGWTPQGNLQVWQCDNCMNITAGTRAPSIGQWRLLGTLESAPLASDRWNLALWVQPDDPEHVVIAGRSIWRKTTPADSNRHGFFSIGNGNDAPYVPLGAATPAYSAPQDVHQIVGVARTDLMSKPLAQLHDCTGQIACRYELWFASDDGLYRIDIAGTSAAKALSLGTWSRAASATPANALTVAGTLLSDKEALVVAGIKEGGVVYGKVALDATITTTLTTRLADRNSGLAWLFLPPPSARTALNNGFFVGGTSGYFTPFRKYILPGNEAFDLLPPDVSVRSGLSPAAMSTASGASALPPYAIAGDAQNRLVVVGGPDRLLWLGRGLDRAVISGGNANAGWSASPNPLPFVPSAVLAKAFPTASASPVYVVVAGLTSTTIPTTFGLCLYAGDLAAGGLAPVMSCQNSLSGPQPNALALGDDRIWLGTSTGLRYITLANLLGVIGQTQTTLNPITLNSSTVNTLTTHPWHPSWVYVGTPTGLQYSQDLGATWTWVGATQNTAVNQVNWLEDGRALVANAGGVWISEPLAPVRLRLVVDNATSPATFAMTAMPYDCKAAQLDLDYQPDTGVPPSLLSWNWSSGWGGRANSTTGCVTGTAQTLVSGLPLVDLCKRDSPLSKIFSSSLIRVNGVPYALGDELEAARGYCGLNTKKEKS